MSILDLTNNRKFLTYKHKFQIGCSVTVYRVEKNEELFPPFYHHCDILHFDYFDLGRVIAIVDVETPEIIQFFQGFGNLVETVSEEVEGEKVEEVEDHPHDENNYYINTENVSLFEVVKNHNHSLMNVRRARKITKLQFLNEDSILCIFQGILFLLFVNLEEFCVINEQEHDENVVNTSHNEMKENEVLKIDSEIISEVEETSEDTKITELLSQEVFDSLKPLHFLLSKQVDVEFLDFRLSNQLDVSNQILCFSFLEKTKNKYGIVFVECGKTQRKLKKNEKWRVLGNPHIFKTSSSWLGAFDHLSKGIGELEFSNDGRKMVVSCNNGCYLYLFHARVSFPGTYERIEYPFYRGRKPARIRNISFSQDKNSTFFSVLSDRKTVHIFSTNYDKSNPNQFFKGKFSSYIKSFASYQLKEDDIFYISKFSKKRKHLCLIGMNDMIFIGFDEKKGGKCELTKKGHPRKKGHLTLFLRNFVCLETLRKYESGYKGKDYYIVHVEQRENLSMIFKDDEEYFYRIDIRESDGRSKPTTVRTTFPRKGSSIRKSLLEHSLSFNLSLDLAINYENSTMVIYLFHVKTRKKIISLSYILPSKIFKKRRYCLTNFGIHYKDLFKTNTKFDTGEKKGKVSYALAATIGSPIMIALSPVAGMLGSICYPSLLECEKQGAGILDIRGVSWGNILYGIPAGFVGGVFLSLTVAVLLPLSLAKDCLQNKYLHFNLIATLSLQAQNFGRKKDELDSIYKIFDPSYQFDEIIINIFRFLLPTDNKEEEYEQVSKVSKLFCRISRKIYKQRFKKDLYVFKEGGYTRKITSEVKREYI